MRKTKDKVKEPKIPPEGAMEPAMSDPNLSEEERIQQILNAPKPLPPISSGIEELDEAFKQAFKFRPPNKKQ